MPKVDSEERYQEDEGHRPDPTAMRGTLDTTGLGAGEWEQVDAATPVFGDAKDRVRKGLTGDEKAEQRKTDARAKKASAAQKKSTARAKADEKKADAKDDDKDKSGTTSTT